jgi:CheY-like chemotaxis protein
MGNRAGKGRAALSTVPAAHGIGSPLRHAEGKDQAMAETRAQGDPAGKGQPRVLIVDDDDDFCASTTALLECEGYAVSRAKSGKEALAKVTGGAPPDLIVLDVMMEHLWAGYEVNQAIKFAGGSPAASPIPILMVSSVSLDPTERFRWAGEVDMVTPDDYLTKPLDIPRFLGKVKSLLRQTP